MAAKLNAKCRHTLSPLRKATLHKIKPAPVLTILVSWIRYRCSEATTKLYELQIGRFITSECGGSFNFRQMERLFDCRVVKNFLRRYGIATSAWLAVSALEKLRLFVLVNGWYTPSEMQVIPMIPIMNETLPCN
jgi:hypothetical protein